MVGTMTVLYTVLVSLFMAIQVAKGQSDLDTYGTYFRIVFIDNFVDCPVERPVDIYICNPQNSDIRVNVTIPHLNHPNCPAISQKQLDPQTCVRFELCQEIRHTYADGSLAKKVVEVFANQDVSVQGFNVEKFSADSYVILPWHLNGYHYFVMAYTLQSIQTQFAIVAKEVATIRIVIPDRTGETITVDYNGLRYTNGETFVFKLEPDTTFLAQSAGDLTGVMIQSNRKVAVFTGNVRTYNDYSKTSRDHLVEQVPPVARWGINFVFVPVPRKTPGDVVKIIAFDDKTILTLLDGNGERQITIGRAPTILMLNTTTHLRADGWILVAVVIRSQQGRKAGLTDPADPSMYFLPSIEQYGNDYLLPAFKDADGNDYQKVWVLMAIPEESVGNVLVDGNRLKNVSFLTGIGRNGALPYRAGAYQVSSSTMHRIRMENNNFMAVAYGASDRESFASALGYRFTNFFGCEQHDMVELADGLDNDCDGLFDEETCGDGKDNDGDELVDEDCGADSTKGGSGESSGTNFAIVFMSNVVRDIATIKIDQIELYIATLMDNTTVSVTAPAYRGIGKPVLQDVKTSPGSVLQIPLNPNMRVTPSNSKAIGRSTKTPKVIKVTSNKNINVYGINKKQYSTDGFLALPEMALGSEYYAFCNFPINTNDDRCQFAAAAVKDNTEIVVDIPVNVKLDGIDGGEPIQGPRTLVVRLADYEAIEIQSADDLTGVRVYTRDGKKFAFFSGNIRARLPLNRRSRDHLVEQLPSTDTWGTVFATMPTPREGDEGDVYKVIAKEQDTRVKYWHYPNGASAGAANEEFILQKGGHRDVLINVSSAMTIKSNKPIQVIQISKSAPEPPASRLNDPAAILVIPENRWSNNYLSVNPLSGQRNDQNLQEPYDNYILIAVRRKHRQGIEIDLHTGSTVPIGRWANWTAMPGDNDIEGLVYQLPDGVGQNSITHRNPDATWMALMFGKSDRETYGNPAGLRFHSSKCSSVQMEPGDGIDNDCDGRIDEEMMNNIDDDGDGKIDEDLGVPPAGYRYAMVFEENIVEYPRNYALEMYVGKLTDEKIICRMETPAMHHAPSYDITTIIHDPSNMALSDKIQFAVSAALRATGTGIHYNSILMTCNAPVTVMGINKETLSSDAFIAFEEKTLGNEYYTVSFGKATIQTQFAVVAIEDGITNVEMNMKAQISWNEDDDVNFLRITLARHQLFHAQSEEDLTGSHIKADKKVAVFSGNIRTKVKLSRSRDHLASQLPPTASWGTKFNIVPTWFRTVGDVIRIVAQQDDTEVLWNAQVERINNAGEFAEIDLSEPFFLETTKPVMVMQIVKSQAEAYHSETADPCFILVPPISQYTNISTMITPLYSQGFYKDGMDYDNLLTVIVLNNAREGIRVNDQTVDANTDIEYAQATELRAISGSNYVAVDFNITKSGLGTYTITHSSRNVVFSGYLVGVADRESYCVSIGPNLPNL